MARYRTSSLLLFWCYLQASHIAVADDGIFDGDDLNMDKVIAVYKTLPELCMAGLPTSPMNMAQQCKTACEQDAEEIKQSAAKAVALRADIDKLTGRDKQQAEIKLSNEKNNIGTKLSGFTPCLMNMKMGPYKGPKLTFLPAFERASKVLSSANGGWPPSAPPSLDIDSLIATSPQVLEDVIAQIKAEDALNQLTFTQAQKLLAETAEFKALQQDVNKRGYSAKQLRNALQKLEDNKARIDPAQYQQKAKEFGYLLSKADLVGAVTEPCSIDYLQQYNQDRSWVNPALQANIRPERTAGELQYQLESPYFHRLCAHQLHDKLVQMFEQKQDQNGFNTAVAQYLSKPVLAGGVNCRDCPPKRVMSESDWLPKWQPYLSQRQLAFNKDARQNRYVSIQQQAIEQSGLVNWLTTHADTVQKALAFYDAMARSAQHRLEQAKHNPDALISSRAASTMPGVSGEYTLPQIGHRQAAIQRVNLLNTLSCVAVPDALRRFVADPAMADSATMAKIVTGGVNCDAVVQVFNQNGIFAGGWRFLEDTFKDYEIALTITTAKGAEVRQRIRKDANQQVAAKLVVEKERIALTGVDFDTLYAANEFRKQFNNYWKMRSDIGQGVSYVADTGANTTSLEHLFGQQLKTYYQQATKLDYDDKDAAVKHKHQLALNEQQQKLLAKQKQLIDKPVKAKKKVTGNAVKMQFYNNCANGGQYGDFNCECLADNYEKELAANTFKTEYDFLQRYKTICLDRALVKQRQLESCEMRSKYQSPGYDCECFAQTYADKVTGATGHNADKKLLQDVIKACKI